MFTACDMICTTLVSIYTFKHVQEHIDDFQDF